MGRVAKKAPEAAKAESPIQTVTQTRAKRTPKPNPKYANESIIATPKLESSAESNGSSDIEMKLPESKIVKSTKKVIESSSAILKASSGLVKTPPSAASAAVVTKIVKSAIKKQRIDFDDDEKTKDADEMPLLSPTPAPRTTRSGKGSLGEIKEEIKVGNDSVALIDVESIILTQESPTTTTTVKDEPTKITRGSAGRKRQAAEVIQTEETVKEESPKKKKEEEKVSLITTRKSYMPATLITKKIATPEVAVKSEVIAAKKEPLDDEKSLANNIKTRRSVAAPLSSPTSDAAPEKKPKIEIIKTTPMPRNIPEPKKLPMIVPRKEVFTKVMTPNAATGLATKVINVSQLNVVSTGKPAPRLLNTMITPKGAKEALNVKLAGDGTDRKVFSIEIDGSVVEKKAASPNVNVKSGAVAVAVKENIATINKPQPSVVLKNKLESELNRMKASANVVKRHPATTQSRNVVSHSQTAIANPAIARRITKFESWYVIDVKNQETMPALRHVHTFSLIQLGNNIKEIELPSAKWEYKITLQKRVQKSNNNNDGDEVYTGEMEKHMVGEKHNYEPNCILFKRSHKDNNRVMIDRSLMFKLNMYAITMNGKQCHLLGAPSDIKSLEDVETLLQIVDASSASHTCVEPTN